MSGHSRTKKTPITKIIASIAAVAIVALGGLFIYNNSFSASSENKTTETTVTQEASKQAYTASEEEKEYLSNKFKGLLATNSETVG